MKIYTRGGDNGTTNLINSSTKHPKSNLVFEVLGTLDELNAFLGLTQNSRLKDIKASVLNIQSDLLHIGAYVAGKKLTKEDIEIWNQRIVILEQLIDKFDEVNEPLSNFILPGGSSTSANLHICRAVCRRLERVFVEFLENTDKKDLSVFQKYINRLSDFLFIAARYSNSKLGVKDLIWNN